MEIPESGMFLWNWFWAVNKYRIENRPLRSADFRDWPYVYNTPIRAWELEALKDMDFAFRSAMADEIADSQKRQRQEAEMKGKR